MTDSLKSVERIALSILNADFGRLADEIHRVRPHVDLLHIDVMDGHFVPNISVGMPVVRSLRKATDLYFDCHLMISNPGEHMEPLKKAGADGCSIHIETGDTDAVIAQMRELGLDVGLAVNPVTPYEQFEPYLDKIDMLLVMTVVPGFGGQSFIHDVMPKLTRARDEIRRRELSVAIEVDGGIDHSTIGVAREHGADTFVVGSAIFEASDVIEAAAEIREALALTRGAVQ